jgi:hypothetical protein
MENLSFWEKLTGATFLLIPSLGITFLFFESVLFFKLLITDLILFAFSLIIQLTQKK